MVPIAAKTGAIRLGVMSRPSKANLEYALLKAAEFFRDEVQCGVMLPHQRDRMTKMRDLCWNVLGDPSLKDAHDIELRATINQPNP